ncbi:MAG: Maf-like protein [Tannerella sp.]|jgi:septum formation protein|nr:Maf-like protein [Tannerella sp.]
MDGKIILASNSPRRKELLRGLEIPFEVRLISDIDESYPDEMVPTEIPVFLARKKAAAYLSSLKENELLITADTIVIIDNQVIGKPLDRDEAIRMLQQLSGSTHEVITGVVLTSSAKQVEFSDHSFVDFGELSLDEITHYVDTYCPYDKAGAYGIQEWIGYIGIQGIRGSFYNVMGLPVHKLYQELKAF